ncbi:hypothetical protein AVEN_232312-1 [Araneus ventricosus]|uniref:Uncharacterized protein n=1 Tax=Araneus ventricosus TaxID=182803 RepID=A0A4Y2TZV1_ARAVE|nr:hypothetical protein AVEN_117500-1 [Araneus ventricosus]GBO04950.1 hypothetical protein AVEN_232312-1 [Araneus ventricosus]
MPDLMVKIPAEYLSERQKKLLRKKPRSKDEPLTSSGEKEDVFKVPHVPPFSKNELREKLMSEWDKIEGIVCANLVKSIPQRLNEDIKCKGGPTHY